MNIDALIFWASVIGTIAFSISGALIAIECKLDILGVIMLGALTACGGGILRDIMLHTKMGIFEDPFFITLSAIVSLLVFIAMYFLKNLSWIDSKIYKTIFTIIDSIGLGAFVVVGANISLNSGADSMFAVCFYGVLTAVGGGLIRDIIVNKIPAIFRKHIYALAAIIGAIYFYLIESIGLSYAFAVISTVLLVLTIRFLSYYFELGLPRVKFKKND